MDKKKKKILKQKVKQTPRTAESASVKLQKHDSAHRIRVLDMLGLGSTSHSLCPKSHFCSNRIGMQEVLRDISAFPFRTTWFSFATEAICTVEKSKSDNVP